MRISARSAAALAARVRGGSSAMDDLPEVFGGFLASNANGSHVGEDSWPWRHAKKRESHQPDALYEAARSLDRTVGIVNRLTSLAI